MNTVLEPSSQTGGELGTWHAPLRPVDAAVASKAVSTARRYAECFESFARFCGQDDPEQWIEYLPSLMGMVESIQHYSCFMSHSTKDKAIADRLHGRMLQE
jgi:hypothetical protein